TARQGFFEIAIEERRHCVYGPAALGPESGVNWKR
ncbi:MAG: hypothetical protein ACI9K5_002512, partial [Gammaproteobacteria bacterium]